MGRRLLIMMACVAATFLVTVTPQDALAQPTTAQDVDPVVSDVVRMLDVGVEPELVLQWLEDGPEDGDFGISKHIATQAARWGADTELEACCEWLGDASVVWNGDEEAHPGEYLRADRRPTSNRSHWVIDRVWTYMTDEAPATHTQAELAVEAVEMWLRHQGQTEAAELLKNQQIG